MAQVIGQNVGSSTDEIFSGDVNVSLWPQSANNNGLHAYSSALGHVSVDPRRVGTPRFPIIISFTMSNLPGEGCVLRKLSLYGVIALLLTSNKLLRGKIL